MNNGIKFQFLGGVEEVGRLSMYLEIENSRLLFEYGMCPGKPPEYPMHPPMIDKILLTHAHLDHSGMIPWLFQRSDQEIITTGLTGEIANLLHKDSIKIAKMEGYAIPYSNKDIKLAKSNVVQVKPNQTRNLSENIDVKFHDAGHIPGSLMFEVMGDKKILFTGDINTIDTRLVNGTKPVNCDILFLEGTYSGREHPDKRENIEKELLEKIEGIINRGGIAILPAFAVSRSQELAMILRKSGFEVWLDGMGKKVAKYFLKHPKYLKDSKELKKAMNKINLIHSDRGRKIAIDSDVIITSSGMMDGGPVLSYMYKLRNDPKSGVVLTGYQVPDSNARLLVDHGQLDFYGVKHNIECSVDYFDFSAHAGHSELVNFAKGCRPEKIVLMHSDDRKPLADDLSEIAEIIIPKTGETIEL